VKPFVIRAVLAGVCALSLVACVDSSSPILPDSQAVFGPRLKLQLYSVRNGYAHDPEPATYSWNGALYAKAGGGTHDVADRLFFIQRRNDDADRFHRRTSQALLK